jgi:hypothetical protein
MVTSRQLSEIKARASDYADKSFYAHQLRGDIQALIAEVERLLKELAVDQTKPHWKCVCGAVAMPLTDDTECRCRDIYLQDWMLVDSPEVRRAWRAAIDAAMEERE